MLKYAKWPDRGARRAEKLIHPSQFINAKNLAIPATEAFLGQRALAKAAGNLHFHATAVV